MTKAGGAVLFGDALEAVRLMIVRSRSAVSIGGVESMMAV